MVFRSSSGIFDFPKDGSSNNFSSDQPDHRSDIYKKYESTWEYVLDIYEGKRRWFDPGTGFIVDWEKAFLYLPQSKDEPNEAYIDRVKRSRFDRKFRDAIHDSSNFIYEASLLPDTPAFIKRYENNIDRQGNDLKTFLRSADIKALRDERCGILVEYPPARVDEYGDPIPLSLSEIKAENIRPYLVLIDVRDVINHKIEKKNGVERITQLTLREYTEIDDGEYSTKMVERYRVLRPGSYQLFQKNPSVREDLRAEVVLMEEGRTSLSEIPFVWYHVNPFEMSTFEGMPPLLDLADLNLAYYRKVSNKDELLFKCTVPVFVVNPREGSLTSLDTSAYFADERGNYQRPNQAEGSKGISIGPNTLLQNCDAYFVEPSGAALGAIQSDIQAIEMAMDSKKYAFQSGAYAAPPTATEVIRASLTNEANIAALARAKENAVRKTFQYWCDYEDSDREKCGGISVDMSSLRRLQNQADIGYLNMLLSNQVISPAELAESISQNKSIQEVIDLEARRQPQIQQVQSELKKEDVF